MNTPIQAWLAAADVGGQLGMAGDKLRMLLPPDCPPELKDAIRRHKAALLVLLNFNFLTVRSDALQETIFWTPDAATKEALIEAGAAPGSVYTAAELERLTSRRVTAAELPVIHQTKRTFDGTIR